MSSSSPTRATELIRARHSEKQRRLSILSFASNFLSCLPQRSGRRNFNARRSERSCQSYIDQDALSFGFFHEVRSLRPGVSLLLRAADKCVSDSDRSWTSPIVPTAIPALIDMYRNSALFFSLHSLLTPSALPVWQAPFGPPFSWPRAHLPGQEKRVRL